MNLAYRAWLLFLFFGLLVVATRWQIMPDQVFGFDDVNLAYSIKHFDIRISQPQPPGYPLYVMEMRALWWLHFRRVETILQTLALAGGIAALLLTALAGNSILGGESGFYAALLLLFQPAFWVAGISSGLRVHLAIISMAVGAACWRAWSAATAKKPGEGRWVLWSALALGIGAGVRPEAGPLLFPLWAVSALRAPVKWRDRMLGLAAMAAAVLAWLLPAMYASGGPAEFINACTAYLSDQSSLSSGFFGASGSDWTTAFWRMIAWTFCGVPGWALAAVLAWRRGEGWGLGRERAAFLALWLAPPLVFAITVHAAAPGHTLLMVPVLALFGGFLVDRAVDRSGAPLSRWDALLFGLLPVVAMLALDTTEFTALWLPPACVAAGLALKSEPMKNNGYPLRATVALAALAPAILLNAAMFYHRGWYYRGPHTTGWRAAMEQALTDLNSGMEFTSYEQVYNTVMLDDQSVRQVFRLAKEKPGNTWVVWEEGPTAWRKVAYYAPQTPLVVLEHAKIHRGSPAVVSIWKGPAIVQSIEGAPPLRVTLPAGARVVWMIGSRSDFYNRVRQAFPLTAAGPVWYTDLPREDGSRTLGEYQLAW